MKEPHIEDYETWEDFKEAEMNYDSYIDSKIEENKEEQWYSHNMKKCAESMKNKTALINENTLNELKRLNEEIEGDLKDGN